MDQARLTPNTLPWENVSVEKCQPDDMGGQRSKEAASSGNISVSPRYSGRVLVLLWVVRANRHVSCLSDVSGREGSDKKPSPPRAIRLKPVRNKLHSNEMLDACRP